MKIIRIHVIGMRIKQCHYKKMNNLRIESLLLVKNMEKNYAVLVSNLERVTRYIDNYERESKKKIHKYMKYSKKLLLDYKKNIILDTNNKIYRNDTLEFRHKLTLIKKKLDKTNNEKNK